MFFGHTVFLKLVYLCISDNHNHPTEEIQVWKNLIFDATEKVISLSQNKVISGAFTDYFSYILLKITKSSSATGSTKHRLGNTSTCPYYAFRHITKSSSAVSCVLQLIMTLYILKLRGGLTWTSFPSLKKKISITLTTKNVFSVTHFLLLLISLN